MDGIVLCLPVAEKRGHVDAVSDYYLLLIRVAAGWDGQEKYRRVGLATVRSKSGEEFQFKDRPHGPIHVDLKTGQSFIPLVPDSIAEYVAASA
jgi:hypothetical protein